MITQLHRTASVSIGSAAAMLGAFAFAAPADAAPTTPIPKGTPPVAVITLPKTIYAGIPITLSAAKSTDTGAGVSEWEWDLDGNGRYERDSLSSSWVSKNFTRGSHTVRLRVRNSSGLVGTTTKTFTAKNPPSAVSEPIAPTAVTATADGTAVEVNWQEPLGAAPLTYRVNNGSDEGTDPIYVPADTELTTTFDGLVPGSYTVRVAGVNDAGTGPATEAVAEVLAKGAPSSSATATAVTSSPTATGDPQSPTAAPTEGTTSSSSGGGNGDTIGIALIAAGGVVLLGAGITAVVAGWRRRRVS